MKTPDQIPLINWLAPAPVSGTPNTTWLTRAVGCVLFSPLPRHPLWRPAFGVGRAMEVTLSRKGAKSRTRGRKIYLTGAKARVGRRQVNLFLKFGADGCTRRASVEGGWRPRFFCRAWRTGVDGSQDAVLAVVSAEEHPTPGLVGRLAHE